MHAQSRLFVSLVLVLVDCSHGAPTEPDVLQGSSLVFSRALGVPDWDVWLRDPTGQLRDLTLYQRNFDGEPVWSPDGNRILFSSQRDSGITQVFVMNADGSQPTKLTGGAGGGAGPSWSPDGARIAFESSGNLWIVNADGSLPVRLTLGGTDRTPAWSPDGRMLAFSSARGTHQDIWVLNLQDSSLTNLTNGVGFGGNNSPNWSPDGRKIVYFSDQTGNFEIFSMNADGTSQVQLTHLNQSAMYPRYTPNGGSILFSAGACSCLKDIFIMNPDGSNQRIVSHTQGADAASLRP